MRKLFPVGDIGGETSHLRGWELSDGSKLIPEGNGAHEGDRDLRASAKELPRIPRNLVRILAKRASAT